MVAFAELSGDNKKLDGLVKTIAVDFDAKSITKAAKSSNDIEIAKVRADIEALAKVASASICNINFNSKYFAAALVLNL